MRDAQSVYYLVSMIAVALPAGWALLRFVWPRLRPYLHALLTLDTVASSLADILHEVKPNGGGSLRDEIRAIARDTRTQGVAMRAYLDLGALGEFGAIFEADPEGRNTWVNTIYQQWLGRSEGALLGMGWLTSVAAEEREFVRDEWQQAVADRREFRARYHLITDRGERIAVDCIARVVADPLNGQVHRYIGHLRRRSAAPLLQDNGA